MKKSGIKVWLTKLILIEFLSMMSSGRFHCEIHDPCWTPVPTIYDLSILVKVCSWAWFLEQEHQEHSNFRSKRVFDLHCLVFTFELCFPRPLANHALPLQLLKRRVLALLKLNYKFAIIQLLFHYFSFLFHFWFHFCYMIFRNS